MSFSTRRCCEQLSKGSCHCIIFTIALSFGSFWPLSYQASEILSHFWSGLCHLQKMTLSLGASSVYLSWKPINSWARHFLLCFDGSSSPGELLQIWKNVLEDCMCIHQKAVAKTELKLICKNGGVFTFLLLVLNTTISVQKYGIIRKLIKFSNDCPLKKTVSFKTKPKEFLTNEEHRDGRTMWWQYYFPNPVQSQWKQFLAIEIKEKKKAILNSWNLLSDFTLKVFCEHTCRCP